MLTKSISLGNFSRTMAEYLLIYSLLLFIGAVHCGYDCGSILSSISLASDKEDAIYALKSVAMFQKNHGALERASATLKDLDLLMSDVIDFEQALILAENHANDCKELAKKTCTNLGYSLEQAKNKEQLIDVLEGLYEYLSENWEEYTEVYKDLTTLVFDNSTDFQQFKAKAQSHMRLCVQPQ